MDENAVKPADVSDDVWASFRAIWGATPGNRRTMDLPLNDGAAQDAIRRMATSALANARARGVQEGIAQAAAIAPATQGADRPGLPFSPKDVPQYTGDYMDYRRKLRDFVHVYQDLPVNKVASAMFALKAGLIEKRMSELGSSKDATEFAVLNGVQQNFLQAWTHWQTWMDGLLISSTQLVQENQSWNEMKKKARKAETAQEFYMTFEACLYRFNEACIRTGTTRPTTDEITRHFIEALPYDIAAAARPLSLLVLGAAGLDRDPYRTHKDILDGIWPTLRKAGPKNLFVPGEKRPRDEEEEDEPATRFAKRGKTLGGRTKDRCRQSWEDAPANLQGNIRYHKGMDAGEIKSALERRARIKKAGVCVHCRLPRTKGHELDTFEARLPDWEGPQGGRVRYVPEAEEEEQEAPDDQED